MVDKKYFYNITLADKGINHVGQLFYNNGAMKPWSVFKSEYSLSENSHLYCIELNDTILKAWKQNLYNGDKSFYNLTFSGHRIIKKYQIYSLTKCNSKELHSLHVSLNDSKTKSQINFETRFQNKEIEWRCIYYMPYARSVTVGTNLHICFSIKF